MKKIILAAVMLMFTLSVFSQKTYEIIGTTEKTFFVDENMPDGFKSCTIYFHNTSDQDIVIQYEKINIDFPSAWMVNFCDNKDCLPNFPNTGSYASIKPKDTTDMKLDVFPSGGSDTALVQYAIWDQARANDRDTLSFRMFARWGLGWVQSSRVKSQLFPNPSAQKIVTVQGERMTSVACYNLNGQLLVSQNVTDASQVPFDISGLPVGTYLLKVNHAKGSDTHTLIVTR
jgi:hypothetical protein